MRKSVPLMDFGSVSGEALKRANLHGIPSSLFVVLPFFLAVGMPS